MTGPLHYDPAETGAGVCDCPDCHCANPAGGSVYASADGACWDCEHGRHVEPRP